MVLIQNIDRTVQFAEEHENISEFLETKRF